jgi:Domain of unknown function (DUF5666)
VGIIALIIGVGAGYFIPHGAAAATTGRGSFSGAGGTFTRGAGGTFTTGGAGAGGTVGQIISAGNGSITIQSAMSSSTQIILVSDSTQILKTVSGSTSDLAPGTTVIITGTPNSDGSLTAQSIQIRPAGMNFGGRTGASTQ